MHSVLAPRSAGNPASDGVGDPADSDTASPEVPRFLVLTSAAVVLAGVAMAVAGAFATGVTWDEPIHVMRLHNFFERGWFSLDWAAQDDAIGAGDNTLVYGPVAMLLLHALTAAVGVEGWSDLATTPAAYDARHLGVVVIGLVGTAAAAAITRIVLQSWRWALVTAAALLALPMWTGHLMFNIKDVPVATGYTLMTLALVAMVVPVSGRRLQRVGCLVAGVVLMVGTRPGMWTAVAVGLVVLVAGAIASGRFGRFGGGRVTLLEAVTGVVIGFVVLAAIYPHVFSRPWQLVTSATQSASFRGGREASYGYVPFFVLVQTPLLLLIAFGIGLFVALSYVARRWRTETSQATRITLVGAQLLALPLAATVKHSDLYDALRQVLFATPAWAVLVTVGLANVLSWTRTRWAADTRRRRVGVGLVGLALVAPIVEQATQFPYQYTYFNVGLDLTGAHVPSDYWRTSIAELLPDLPTDGTIICSPTRTGSPRVAGRYSQDSSADCRVDPLGPLESRWSAEHKPVGDTLPHDTFYVIVDRDHPTPANCTRMDAVTRNRHGRSIAMTYLARCTLEPLPLGTRPVAFEQNLSDPYMSPERWAYAAEGWAMRRSITAIDSEGATASMTFQPTGCASGCDMVLDADVPSDVTATVNGEPVQARSGLGGVVIHLDSGTAPAWVTFARRSGLPLEMRVRSIRLGPADEELAS